MNIFPAMLLLGAGAALSFPTLTSLAMSDATSERAGLISGLVNTTQQIGGALGLAVLATLATTRTSRRLAEGAVSATALTDGYHLAFWVGAGLVVVAVIVAIWVVPAPQEASSAVAAGDRAEEPHTAAHAPTSTTQRPPTTLRR